MSNINNTKKTFYVDSLGYGGSISNLELAWLQSKGATASNLQDAWDEYLVISGYANGSINDRKKTMLVDAGHWTGNINESFLVMYAAGDVPPASDLYDVLISIGALAVPLGINKVDVANTPIALVNTAGEAIVDEGLGNTVRFTASAGPTFNTTGVPGNDGTNVSIQNANGCQCYGSSSSYNEARLDLSSAGLDPAKYYTVQFVGSRATARTTIPVIGGVRFPAVATDANPPIVTEATNVLGSTLISTTGVWADHGTGNYPYMSMVRITEEE